MRQTHSARVRGDIWVNRWADTTTVQTYKYTTQARTKRRHGTDSLAIYMFSIYNIYNKYKCFIPQGYHEL
jgi:hypothetical protein